MKKKKDLPLEIDPVLPNSEAIKEIMEEYRARDEAEAPSAMWFFGGVIVVISLIMIAVCLTACNLTLTDSEFSCMQYYEKDHLENSTDSKSLLDITPKAL